MQICWNCEAEQLDGSIFCSECGANLIKQNARPDKTRTSLTTGDVDVVEDDRIVSTPPVMQTDNLAHTFSLMVLDSGARVELVENRELMIGRTDEKRGIVPDIDLGSFGGYDAGVSRRHAIIFLHHKHCVIKDLGSANGTFINNRRVSPNQPTLINHGDELRFGTLVTRIEFSTSQGDETIPSNPPN